MGEGNDQTYTDDHQGGDALMVYSELFFLGKSLSLFCKSGSLLMHVILGSAFYCANKRKQDAVCNMVKEYVFYLEHFVILICNMCNNI